ncbi:MAG: glycosyltransferase family 2 protein [Candidatus Micrarchaeia archaeon]
MDYNPKVSIIIPTYNRAQYLGQAIKSALNQDYPNKEIIVSDNASTDNTFEVVKQFMNYPEFKYFRNETNIGMVPNWRKALYEYATGEYAIILSDDDFFVDKSYISKAIKLFRENPTLGLVHANWIIWRQDKGCVLKTVYQLPSIMDGREYFFNFELNYPNPSFCSVVFNINLAKDVQAFSEEVAGSDTLLWFKMMLFADVGFVNDVVVVYRLHGKNTILNIPIQEHLQNLIVYTKPADIANQIGFHNMLIENWKERLVKNYIVNFLRIPDLLKVYNKYDIRLSQILKRVFKELIKYTIVFFIGYKNFYLVKESIYEKFYGKKLNYSVVRDKDYIAKLLSGGI